MPIMMPIPRSLPMGLLRRLLMVVALAALPATASTPRIVGYYPSWLSGVLPHTAVRYDLLTHIAHAFVFPRADGTIDQSGFSLYPELIQAAHAQGVKVVIAVGGWDAVRTPNYASMAADPTARATFVSQITSFCQTNGYDGVDLDWEYPKTAADRTNFTALVRALRVAFDAAVPRLSLSMAGPAGWWSGQWFELESVSADLDWIGMMTYDFHGAWTSVAGPNSPLYAEPQNTQGWVENAVTYYRDNRSVPAGKLLVGVPFYGQRFTASSLYGSSTGATQVQYRNIAPLLSQGWTRYWNATGRYPYLISPAGTAVLTYDDSLSVAEKGAYVRANNLGGVILWALGQDLVGDTQPLLSSVERALRPVASVVEAPDGGVPEALELLPNYPNPFNAQTRIRYRVPSAGMVRLTLHDMLGRDIRTLAEGHHEAGSYDVTLSSSRLSAGTYVIRLMTERAQTARPCIVLP